eukprot:jgi/Chrzof1/7957/UNPLg00017.t1
MFQSTCAGYEVQTVRVATQPFDAYVSSPRELVAAAEQIQSLANQHGIPLISIGSSSNPDYLPYIPAAVADTSTLSCSFLLQKEYSWQLLTAVAETVLQISALTDGHGNFRFAAAAVATSGIPYFPVATAGPDHDHTFAIGTECDGLLHAAFQSAAAQSAERPTADILQLAADALRSTLLLHYKPVQAAAKWLEAVATTGYRYLGLDTSVAPGLDTPPLTASYECLGVCDKFGGPGTLSISAMITGVLKSLQPLQLTGYCGLMLAVCEDQGLAAAAARGDITISDLLTFSSVCGCGLDTVPVPGPSSSSNGTALQGDCEAGASSIRTCDAGLCKSIAAVILDVVTLAHRATAIMLYVCNGGLKEGPTHADCELGQQ